jgi:hypothetical protein
MKLVAEVKGVPRRAHPTRDALPSIIPIQVELLIAWCGSPGIGIVVPGESVVVVGICVWQRALIGRNIRAIFASVTLYTGSEEFGRPTTGQQQTRNKNNPLLHGASSRINQAPVLSSVAGNYFLQLIIVS